MAVTQYIGARYVPLFSEPLEWDITKAYEPLTIVYYQGNSYTSKQAVPANIDINNSDYWAITGNYNAQIEQYRSEVRAFDGRITNAQKTADGAAADAQTLATDLSAEIANRTSADNAIRADFAQDLANEASQLEARIDSVPVINADDLINSTLTDAYVLGVSNNYVTNLNARYKKVEGLFENDLKRFCIQNKNGDWLAPVLTEQNAGTTGNALPAILNAMSYLGKSNVTYNGTPQVFDPELSGNANGLVCADYTMLYLMGCDYNNSAFVGQPNLRTKYRASIPKDTTSRVGDEVLKLGWNTREQMFAAFAAGDYAYTKNPTVDMMQPGDVLYSCDWEGELTYEYLWRAQHCAVVVDTDPATGFYTVLESTQYVGSDNHQWCLTSQGGKSPNSVVMTYKNAKNLNGFMLFRPSFNPTLGFEKILNRRNSTSISVSDTITRQFNIDPEGSATIPQNTLIRYTVSSEVFKTIFTANPALNRLYIALRGKNSETAMADAPYVARRVIYREDIIDSTKHLPSEISFVGYTLTDVVQFGNYIYTNGLSTSIQLDDFKYKLEGFSLEPLN